MGLQQRLAREKRNKRIHEFLLGFFDEDKYSTKEINGFILEKRFSGATNQWEVAIYDKDGFAKKQAFWSETHETSLSPKFPIGGQMTIISGGNSPAEGSSRTGSSTQMGAAVR